MSWRGKSVLVTGAGGFIGSHLTERLVALGASTRALVHYNSAGRWGWLDESSVVGEIDVVAGDITDRDCVEEAMHGVDVVFHLAALIAIPYSYRAPGSYLRTNALGTLNVLQAAAASSVQRVVHTSTSEVYGTARYVPIDEGHPLHAQSPYSASKIAADKMAEAFHCSFDVPVVTVRPFNTYGPRQSSRAVIPTLITQLLAGQDLRLGNLTPTRDFNFVADTVEGFVCAGRAEGVDGEVLNLGTGTEVSIRALAELLMGLTGRSVQIECDAQRVRPPSSEVDRLVAANDRAKQRLGWTPATSLSEGLSTTIQWIRQNMERFRIDQYTL